MEIQNKNVIEVTQETFESQVLEASFQRTIVIDFWAPWCAPCRTLTPILEKVIASYGEKAVLAKINVDENQWLSQQFGIQSIPAVKIVQQGRIVGEFMGAQPEQEIRNIFEQIIGSPMEDTGGEDTAGDGFELLKQGNIGEAESYFQELLTDDPQNSKALLGLGQAALARNDLNQAEEHLKAVEPDAEEHDQAEGLLNRIEFVKICGKAGGKEAFEEKLKTDENDLDARYNLACCLAAEENYQQALEEFLTIVKKNKKYKEGLATKAMVKVFSIIGQRHPMSDEYRDKLEWLLY